MRIDSGKSRKNSRSSAYEEGRQNDARREMKQADSRSNERAEESDSRDSNYERIGTNEEGRRNILRSDGRSERSLDDEKLNFRIAADKSYGYRLESAVESFEATKWYNK